MLDQAFPLRSLLSETEESTFYYISGYFAFKENIAAIELVDTKKAFQALNLLLSRGKFSHSSLEIFQLSCAVYYCYKKVDKSCVNHLLQAFHEIYESSQLQDLDQKKILKRFVNCFSKTYVFPESEELKMKQKNSIRCKCA